MDIRVQSYLSPTRPVGVTSFRATGNLPAATVVQSGAEKAPVSAITPARPLESALTQNNAQQLTTRQQLTQLAQEQGRGRLFDLYA